MKEIDFLHITTHSLPHATQNSIINSKQFILPHKRTLFTTFMAAILYASVHYWLVDHPIIASYDWNSRQIPGASPLFLSTAVAAYLSTTLLLHQYPILPTLPAAALRLIAAAHSSLLSLLSLVMAVGCSLSVLHQTPANNPTFFICLPAGGAARGPTYFWGHVFYLSKILEFVDTALILLSRSRSRRLSFLHVYHHAVVPAMCYAWLAAPASMFPLAVVTNACVHVLMYAYYAAAAAGFRPGWKRVLTDCQIVQFLFVYLVSGMMLRLHFTGPGCSGIRAWAFTAVSTTLILALFVNFRQKNYTHEKKII